MAPVLEKNYYSGRDSDGKYRVIQFAFFQVPSPPKIDGLINGALVSLGISQRLEFLQGRIDEALRCYKRTDVAQYRYTLESALISMKRVLDDLVMASFCMVHGDEVASTKRISVDGFGGLYKNGVPTQVGREIIEIFFAPLDDFPQVLAEVVNSYKHSYLLSETQAMWGVDAPTVVSLYAYRNNYSGEVTYHNHSLGQILIGFNKTVERVIERQRQYLEKIKQGASGNVPESGYA